MRPQSQLKTDFQYPGWRRQTRIASARAASTLASAVSRSPRAMARSNSTVSALIWRFSATSSLVNSWFRSFTCSSSSALSDPALPSSSALSSSSDIQRTIWSARSSASRSPSSSSASISRTRSSVLPFVPWLSSASAIDSSWARRSFCAESPLPTCAASFDFIPKRTTSLNHWSRSGT